MRIHQIVFSVLMLATATPLTLQAAAPDGAKTAALRQTLEARFPDIPVLDVKPAPVPGWYEVFTGEAIAYADESGDHLLLGSMMDTRTKLNLTNASLDAHNSIDFATLPFAQSIEVVKGRGTREIAVFSDPDCPFCQKLEHELASVDDVKVHIFLYPLTSLHPDARTKAHAIWCAQDRPQAWVEWMREGKLREAVSCESDPIDELHTLGQKLRINSTPTIFLASGHRISSALSAAELERLLADKR